MVLAVVCPLLSLALSCAPATHTFSGDVSKFIVPVSIVGAGGSEYLVANYSNVFVFDRTAGSMRVATVSMGNVKSKFVPTALAYDAPNERVFIANYLGNNILVGHLDKKNATIRIESEIKDASTISPEGVTFNGSLVAAANFDGSNVQVFQPDGEGWSTKCTIPVRQAHGVTFHGRFIYASSLTDRDIVKIDPEHCAVVARTGSPGWKAGQFLWPTAIVPWDDKAVAISDAHTGLISILDVDSMTVVRQFGGNGPGIDGLNMPYGLVVEEGDVLVTNTFGGKLAAFNKASGAMTDVWRDKPDWKNTLPDLRETSLISEERDYYRRRNVSVTIDGKCYNPDYGSLAVCGSEERLLLRELDGVLLYFVEALRIDAGVLVFSPQAPTGVYYADDAPGRPVKIRLGLDKWVVQNRVVGPAGDVDVRGLIAEQRR